MSRLSPHNPVRPYLIAGDWWVGALRVQALLGSETLQAQQAVHREADTCETLLDELAFKGARVAEHARSLAGSGDPVRARLGRVLLERTRPD